MSDEKKDPAAQEQEEIIETCAICGEVADSSSVSSCSSCNQTICEHCREWHDDTSFCPACFAFVHRCDSCAHWLEADDRRFGVCCNPDAPDYFCPQYQLDACDEWKRLTPDSHRDTLRKIGPVVGEVEQALQGICKVHAGGPGVDGCTGYNKETGRIDCPLWNLCRYMKRMRDGEWNR